MANEFQTSFIPKKSPEVASRRRKSSMSILTLGGLLIFLVAVVASGGVFAYQRILERSIVNKQEALARARESFEPSLIRELINLDNRIKISGTLLKGHISPSSIFGLLEEITLKTVQFDNFDLDVSNLTEGIGLTMQGKAIGFGAVALQSDEFANSIYLKNPVFSNLSISETGEVTFTVNAEVNIDLLAYEGSNGNSFVPDVESESDLDSSATSTEEGDAEDGDGVDDDNGLEVPAI